MKRLLAIAAAACCVYGQQPAKRFEVVSIREATPIPEGSRYFGSVDPRELGASGSRLDGNAYRLLELIAAAYGIPQGSIDCPEWVLYARFAIHATMPEGANPKDLPDMLRTMLEERFHLAAVPASKLASGFDLVRGKGALNLKDPRSQDLSACALWIDVAGHDWKRCTAGSLRDGGVIAFTDSLWGPTTAWYATDYSREEFFSADMAQLASNLEFAASNGPAGPRPVRDATGIEGKHYFVLDRRRDEGIPAPEDPFPGGYTQALDKLGLGLRPAKHPVEYLRIDHIDRTPTEN